LLGWMQFGLMNKFTRSALTATERAVRAGRLCLSIISVWEVGRLESKGRLSPLPGQFHGDPADRLLVATARIEGVSLMTKDDRLLEYGRRGFVKVIAA
jgi:PIN domain nuclease of toxin-antitoxin system